MTDAAAEMSVLRASAPAVLAGQADLGRVLWLLVAGMAAAISIGFALLGLRLDVSSNLMLPGIGVGYTAVVMYYRHVRRECLLACAMTTVGQLFLVLLLGIMLTYAASAIGLPYRDAELHAIDRWLGFDRRSFVAFVESYPALHEGLGIAYSSIMPQMLVIPLVLVLTGQLPRLQRFVLAFGIALVVTSLGHVFVPAAGAYVHVDLGALQQMALPADVYTPYRTLEAVRSGAVSVIRLDSVEGLIAFPSFHTANAILLAWAMWKSRYFRLPALLLNGAMILSTPIGGAHYVVDLLAGAAVAAAAIYTACRIGRDQPPLYTR
jgi:membrane-associated phospholipid phosphatase